MCYIKHVRCKIYTVPEEAWFGQAEYSTTPQKNILRCVGFCLYFLSSSHLPPTPPGAREGWEEERPWERGCSKLSFASVSKRVLAQNFSYESEFDLHENWLIDERHFHINGFAWRLVLTQRQRTSGKWRVTFNAKVKTTLCLPLWFKLLICINLTLTILAIDPWLIRLYF